MSQPTAPRVIVMADLGRSAHLPLAGVVGGEPAQVSDAELRAAARDERAIFDSLSRQRFVVVETQRFGRTDGSHLIRWEVPSLTHLPAAKAKKATVPPRAKRRRR